MSNFPTPNGIRDAAQRIAPFVSPTPLLRSETLSSLTGCDVWLKNETVTAVASFKIRGALNALLQAKTQGVRSIATSSTGNHGQGVAYSGKLLDIAAHIFLPEPVNPIKVRKIEIFGGTVHITDGDIDTAKDAAKHYCESHGGAFIDDGNDTDVMEGAGTIGLEIAETLDAIDAVILPLGGGNLSAGVSTAVKAIQPTAKIFSVQAKGSPAVTESILAGEKLERPAASIAEGLVTRVPPDLALQVLIGNLDDAWLASDEELLAGVHTLIEHAQILVEPSGAAALVGLCQRLERFRGQRVVLLLSGANITREHLLRAIGVRGLL